MYEEVEFESEGATLRGRFYRPLPGSGSGPLVVMAHGFSATVTMTADRYAEAFAAHGLAALLYDHRGFGRSGGEPRQRINPWVQARGYRDALTCATTQPGVDGRRIALWGDSFSGSVVLVVAGVDDRVAAVVAQTPATGGQPSPPDPDGRLYDLMRRTIESGDVRGAPDDVQGPLPVVSADQINAPSLLEPIQAYRWFIEYGGRFGTGWENRATRVTPRTPAPFHAGLAAPHISCPVLVHIAPDDEMAGANPVVARAVAESIAGPAEIREIDGGHFGLLHHPSQWFDDASRDQVEFLARVLTS
ncbi:MAG TPA: alpha/beta fold hydrolase [Acidimicrobiales bacterium]|nr:alpha/beta fold hydrolase [Acidimicrobiales bacterium]